MSEETPIVRFLRKKLESAPPVSKKRVRYNNEILESRIMQYVDWQQKRPPWYWTYLLSVPMEIIINILDTDYYSANLNQLEDWEVREIARDIKRLRRVGIIS